MKKLSALIFFIPFFALAQESKLIFANSFFCFLNDKALASFQINDSSSGAIISSISYYALVIEEADQKLDTIAINQFAKNYFSKDNLTSGVRFTWTGQSEFSDVEIHFNFSDNNEEIKIEVETKYKKDVQVIRESIIFSSEQPVTEVFRRNSAIDTIDFQSEYWLNKEGVQFGNEKKTFLIYHTTEISSLQLNTDKKELIVNLDYYNDHPFQNFPLRDSMMNEKRDLSCSIYKAGKVRKNSFSVYVGKQIDFVPRLMLNPNGFLAAHVFTEHADWTDLPSHRTVYFGSEEIRKAKKATGGFVKNNIPVTKSVFYANPDGVLNSQSSHQSIFSTPIASIKGTKDYLKFLEQLQKRGNEICLHTPDQFTSKRLLTEEACAFMQKHFHSVTWIDHGYNNGPKNNREAFVCDGLNPSSLSYAKDIWEKYGVKYFWNSYYEDFVTEDSLFFDFNGSIIHPYSGFGDASPAPLYWQNPTRSGNFYSWLTRDLLEMPNASSWSFHFSTERLNDFVQERAVKFEHCYPAGSIVGKGYWKFDESKKLVIEPEFEKALEQFASFRDRGLINLTTVRDLLDYWIACKNITYEFIDSTTVKITNQNSKEVKGISFSVNAKNVFVKKRKVQQKFFGGDLIFWLDMKAKESAIMTFSN